MRDASWIQRPDWAKIIVLFTCEANIPKRNIRKSPLLFGCLQLSVLACHPAAVQNMSCCPRGWESGLVPRRKRTGTAWIIPVQLLWLSDGLDRKYKETWLNLCLSGNPLAVSSKVTQLFSLWKAQSFHHLLFTLLTGRNRQAASGSVSLLLGLRLFSWKLQHLYSGTSFNLKIEYNRINIK